jgi:hypothetical protein
MRILHLPTLAVGLGIAGLSIGGLAAYSGMNDTAAAAALAPAAAASSTPVVSSACQQLPVTSTAATPSASSSDSASASPSPTAAASSQVPVDLCISVQAGQDSIQAGQEATWTVEVWVQNGPVSGVTVGLTGSLANQLPTFTNDCPGGNGNTSCAVGNLGTNASQEMQTQITVPSGTSAGTSVALTATANATPSLPSVPAASTAVSIEAASSPSPSPSPSSSATAAKSATPSPTPAAKTSAATTPAAAVAGVGTLPTTGATLAPTEVSEVTDPGSISSLLPVVTPGATATPAAGFVTSPAADSAASPSASADKASDSNFVLILPVATAEKVAVVVGLLMIALALRLRANKKLAPRLLPSRPAPAAQTEPAPGRRKPFVQFNLRRQRGGAPTKTG